MRRAWRILKLRVDLMKKLYVDWPFFIDGASRSCCIHLVCSFLSQKVQLFRSCILNNKAYYCVTFEIICDIFMHIFLEV